MHSRSKLAAPLGLIILSLLVMVSSLALLAAQPKADGPAAAQAQADADQPQDREAAPERPQAETSAAAQPQKEAEAPAPQQGRVYTIRKGDTLTHIARRFGVTIRALAKANGIKDRDLIRSGRRLRIPPSTDGMDAAEDSESSSGFVETALEYRGVPYRYAGMSSRGMDCSGLVAQVLRKHGVPAPHSSKALFKLGEKVSRTDLLPGDLVFFNTTGRGVSHVGIYIGNGQFVHASSSRGKVRVDTLDTGYYARRLVGARRIP